MPQDTPVKVDGHDALFIGMTGYLVTLKVKGMKRTVYLRAGDRLIAPDRTTGGNL